MILANKSVYIYECRIRRWIDGDTFVADIDLGFNTWVSGEHVRLFGIDTPELKPEWSKYAPDGKRTKEAAEARNKEVTAAEEAKSYCEATCPAGSIVLLETKLYTGKYGRTLARVMFRGHDGNTYCLNDLLVNGGLAKVAKY